MTLKISLLPEVIAEHGTRKDFPLAEGTEVVETLMLHGKILKLRQTGPLDFELSHPDGFVSKVALYDVMEAVAEDLCQHAAGRPKDRLP
ncbi:hypothetical protein J7481_06680 [Labrenzia sp. R4_2]|uniref:hypothetical protein n=1 Tax=Labrenzia sp. R4_2 TaxID=2821107 RepID=UPI001ADA4D4B|nr:hypothetical protein [Labrenzia sp. R4_2]MBO9419174.1 hypothetical protein [Labrenzia sp. R4_2]